MDRRKSVDPSLSKFRSHSVVKNPFFPIPGKGVGERAPKKGKMGLGRGGRSPRALLGAAVP